MPDTSQNLGVLQGGVMTQPDGNNTGRNVPRPEQDAEPSELAAVTEWIDRIKGAKRRFKSDFKRMKDNANFAAGLQWKGQKTVDDPRYIANVTLQNINTKVAQLYAKNPKAEYQRRSRLDFQVYNGQLESIIPLAQAASQLGIENLPPQAQAVLADYANGMLEHHTIDMVGKTMEILYQYIVDQQIDEEGDFKTQVKAAVRQTVTTAVGYCLVSFVRDIDGEISSSGATDTLTNRARMAKSLLQQLEDGKFTRDSAEWQNLQSLFIGLGYDMKEAQTSPDVQEKIIYDFLPSSSVIFDPACKSIKGLIGPKWIAIEYNLPLEDVKAVFERPDMTAQRTQQYEAGVEKQTSFTKAQEQKRDTQQCCFWRVLNKKNGTEFYVADGYKSYLMSPVALDPCVKGFYPLAGLTFNDVYIEADQDATIYPPSDVQLMKSAQEEWNRTRNELKKHRKANSPGWITQKGYLTYDDKENLNNASTNQVVELEGVPLGTRLDTIFMPRPKQAIEPAVYDVTQMAQDIHTTGGMTEAATPGNDSNMTATAQTIAQGSMMAVTSSNVDDLDGFLSTIARLTGEIALKCFSKETVVRIVGPGAVWPEQDSTREDFLNQIYLTTKAASSGRPNKAVELRNWQIVGPMLQQLGANPQFLVRETLRRLDDGLNPEEAFPLMPQDNTAQQQPQGGQHQPSPQGEHEQGQTNPPLQSRPGPNAQPPQTPQREAAQQFAQ